MEPTEVMFPIVRTLVDIQRRFLLRLEVLALMPFNENTPWSSLFSDWSMKAKVSYSSLVSRERAFKAALRAAAVPSRGADRLDDAVVTSLDTESLAERSPQSLSCHHHRETGCLTQNATYLSAVPAISLRTRTFACGPAETAKGGYSTPAPWEND